MYVFLLDRPDPIYHWRLPDEFRSIAKIGGRFVAALGSGGFAAFENVADEWRMTGRWQLASFVFQTLSLGDDLFAVCADTAGTQFFRFDEKGDILRILKIPTPEHVFAAAFLPPDKFATANGIYGILRYELQFHDRDASYQLVGKPSDQPVGKHSESGYFMNVMAWQRGFVGENFAGQIYSYQEPALQSARTGLANCLKGAVSDDGHSIALACQGNKISIFSADSYGQASSSKFTYSREIVSLLPSPPLLLVGGFPKGLSVFRMEGKALQPLAEFDTKGTPYAILKDGNRYWIATGKDGVCLLTEENGKWDLKNIRIDDRSVAGGEETVLSY